LDCLTDVWIANGEPALALAAAQEAITLEPFRETGYQRLLRLQVALGNRAEALRTYEECRRLLRDELGSDPSEATQTLYRELLGES
jgi:DNA-binding SARP family transcriptional activator